MRFDWLERLTREAVWARRAKYVIASAKHVSLVYPHAECDGESNRSVVMIVIEIEAF